MESSPKENDSEIVETVKDSKSDEDVPTEKKEGAEDVAKLFEVFGSIASSLNKKKEESEESSEVEESAEKEQKETKTIKVDLTELLGGSNMNKWIETIKPLIPVIMNLVQTYLERNERNKQRIKHKTKMEKHRIKIREEQRRNIIAAMLAAQESLKSLNRIQKPKLRAICLVDRFLGIYKALIGAVQIYLDAMGDEILKLHFKNLDDQITGEIDNLLKQIQS